MLRRRWPTLATALIMAIPAAGVTTQSAHAADTDPPLPAGAVVDQFDGATLGPDWEVLNADPSRYSLTERPGFLRVHSLTGDTWQGSNNARNLFLRDVPDGDFQVIAKFSAPVRLDYQSAGILAWADTDNYLRAGLANVGSAGGQVIENAVEQNAVYKSTFTARPGSTGEVLKVVRTGDTFTTSYWTGTAWAQAAQVTAKLAIKQIGVFALSAGNGTSVTADFDYVAVAAADGKAVLPQVPFALEGVGGPYLSAPAGGGVVAVGAQRAPTQLVFKAEDKGDGTIRLLDQAGGGYLSVRAGKKATVTTNPPAGSDRFTLLDAGGGKVRIAAGSGGYLVVSGNELDPVATAGASTTFVVRPYASVSGDLAINAAGAGTGISDQLYGVFYEDINHAADGGLYAELVQNRSFEFNSVDNAGYTGLTAWQKIERGGATGTIAVDSAQPLNSNNLNSLALTVTGTGTGDAAGVGIRNSGFNTGVALAQGATYDFSVWARSTAATGTPLTVAVESADGATSFGGTQLQVSSGSWQKYAGSFTATAATTTGRLTVLAKGGGVVRLDMVSLFPRETFKGHGLRPDLAQLVADLKPKFVRFPGGCVTNVGNYAAFPDRRRIYRWKDTIGPVEQRPTNFNFWGYNQSYGIGYYEYFQFAEDIGATALPVVSVGVNGCNENRPLAVDQLGPWVQDTLDLIEFANGGVDTPWGAKRAAMGHPKPFGLQYIGLGNEEIYSEFYRNYPYFARAIAAKYPDIKIITNAGQSSSGTTFDKGWQFARDQGADLVDEHYYNSPEWFLANNHRYDSYDRNGPHVFVGEYASRGNTYYNALSEASYLTGIERNADVVDLASYAPLLSNVDYVNWSPDMIWYNNHQSYGSSSYYVQKMFSTNAGDAVLPSTYTDRAAPAAPDIAGGVGLASWNTQVVYDDVKVTGADGTVLLADDFSAGATQWSPTSGSWAVQSGAYVQSSAATDARSTAGNVNWSNYTLELTARKTGGAEGFLVMVGAKDTGNFYWWNLGGWGNTTSGIEKSSGGSKSLIATSGTTIETGRTYRIKITVSGRTITTYLDGVKINQVSDSSAAVEPLYQVVTRDQDTGDLVVKVVNARSSAVRTGVRIEGSTVGATATVTSLTSRSLSDLNTLTEPTKTVPVTLKQSGFSPTFSYDFPAQSVTFIRLNDTRERVDLGTSLSPGAVTTGGAVDAIATVTPKRVTGTPTGTVTVSYGSTVLGQGTLVNGQVVVKLTAALPADRYRVRIAYSGDASFRPADNRERLIVNPVGG